MNSRLLLSFFILLLATQNVIATTRLHPGPQGNSAYRILVGHTLTSKRTASNDIPTPSQAKLDQEKPHVVDFAYFLKKDILIWDELAQDDITISECRFRTKRRITTVTLKGEKIDPTDFQTGVHFSIEQAELEIACMRNFPEYSNIDPEDSYLFFKIIKVENDVDGEVSLVMKVVPGKRVVPIVDFHVYHEDASSAEIEQYQNVVYEEDSPSVDSSGSAFSNETARIFGSGATLPYASKLTLFNKVIPIALGIELEVSADIDVKISSFRLKRLWGLVFEWNQELTASLSAKLQLFSSESSTKRTGTVFRWYIPGLSFSIGLPLVGKLSAGAFVGINWLTEIESSSDMHLAMEAVYKKHETVTVQIIPPSYDAVNKQSGGSSATLSASAGVSVSYKLSGFYGLRPLIGAGLTYTKKKITFRGFRIKVTTETKSINGNLGADIGLELTAGAQWPPFEPFTGTGVKLGTCSTCHALQGSAEFKGKDLGLQTIVGGKITKEKIIVSDLFTLRLGTICLVKLVCPARRYTLSEHRPLHLSGIDSK